MKCYIRRYEIVDGEKQYKDSYFNKNIGFQNHWTPQREARLFESILEAKWIIKLYRLKNCEVYKYEKRFVNNS